MTQLHYARLGRITQEMECGQLENLKRNELFESNQKVYSLLKRKYEIWLSFMTERIMGPIPQSYSGCSK